MSTTGRTRYRRVATPSGNNADEPKPETQIVQPLLLHSPATLHPPAIIKPARTEMGTAADLLNAGLQRAEKKLRELGYGVRASVEIDRWVSPDTTELDDYTFLTFGKRDGKWQLFLESGDASDLQLEESDLLSGGIETRRKAADAIPQLVLALEDARESQVAALKKAEQDLSQFLDFLDATQATPREAAEAVVGLRAKVRDHG